MHKISKTFRVNEIDYLKIEKSLKRTDLNFSEYAIKSLLNQKIHSKTEIKYLSGVNLLKVSVITFLISFIAFIFLINTIVPIRFISNSSWIIKAENRFVDDNDRKFFITNTDKISHNKNITYIYLED